MSAAPLAGRAALVTGASGGIGSAVAGALAALGLGLTLAGRSAERLDPVSRGVGRSGGGGRVEHVVADLTVAGAPTAVVEAHLAAHGRLDVVVDCAGRGWAGALADMGDGDLDRLLPVNVVAPFALVRAALPALRKAGAEHGAALVVLVASSSGVRATAGFAAYSATKAAVVSLARSITLEEAGSGVRATAVCPGFVDTALTARLERIERSRMLVPADVAAAVSFLVGLSPAAAVPEIVLGRLDAGPDAP